MSEFVQLRRITNRQPYLPFIDGLRFFSILTVVLAHYIDFYEHHTFAVTSAGFYQKLNIDALAGNSNNGVMIFFAISGFILAMPFAKAVMLREEPPSLRYFYLRRVTRLEPPYILMLTGLFLASVYLFDKGSAADTFPHYLASVFYAHNIIYKTFPELNFVFWSLEIEVQFYLLAPFLAKIFSVRTGLRRVIIVCTMLVFGIANYFYVPPFISLYNYLPYFLGGFLALDLFLNSGQMKHAFFDVAAVLLLLVVWCGYSRHGPVLPFLIAMLIFSSSASVYFIKILSLKWIAIIGGMCYSIYMLHAPLMGVFYNHLLGNDFLVTALEYDFLLKLVITLAVVLGASTVFYIMVERPLMKNRRLQRRRTIIVNGPMVNQ